MIGLGGLIGRTAGDACIGVRTSREEFAILPGDVTSVAGRREVDDVEMLNMAGLRCPCGFQERHFKRFEDLRRRGVVLKSFTDFIGSERYRDVKSANAFQFVAVAIDLLRSLIPTNAPRITVRLFGVRAVVVNEELACSNITGHFVDVEEGQNRLGDWWGPDALEAVRVCSSDRVDGKGSDFPG